MKKDFSALFWYPSRSIYTASFPLDLTSLALV